MAAISINKNTLFLIKIAILAAVTRILFAFAYYFYYIRTSRVPLYSFDGETYSVTAWYIALLLKGVNVLSLSAQYIPVDCWVNDRINVIIASFGGKFPPFSAYGVGSYAYLLGTFYYIFGYVPMLFRLLNIFINIIAAFLCFNIANRNFGEKSARVAFIIMLILPYHFFYSVSLQRDTIVNFLCILTISLILAFRSIDNLRTKIALLLLSCLSLTALYILRYSVCYMIIASLIFYIFVIIYCRYKYLFVLCALFVISIPHVHMKIIYACKRAILAFLIHHIAFASYGGWIYKLFPINYYIFLNPTIRPTMEGLSFGEMGRLIMVSLKSFITEPWILSNMTARRLFVVPEMIVWYVVLLYSFLGIIASFKRMDSKRAGLLIFLLVFSLVIGMSGANMDALIRHRGMISFIYVIFAAYGITITGNSFFKKKECR